MVNKPLIRPYFWGGSFGGGSWDSHENSDGTFVFYSTFFSQGFFDSALQKYFSLGTGNNTSG